MKPQFTISMSCDNVFITFWCGLEQSVANDAIDQWRRRLSACIGAERRHFEYNYKHENF